DAFSRYPPPVSAAVFCLSLHDALPIFADRHQRAESAVPTLGAQVPVGTARRSHRRTQAMAADVAAGRGSGSRSVVASRSQLALRSEEHTSELQSRENLVCRLLLEKKKV